MPNSEDDMNNCDLLDYMPIDKKDGRMRIYVDDQYN